MHRSKDVRPAASLDTSEPPSLISGLADGHAATVVRHRCDHAAGGHHSFMMVALARMERSKPFRGSSDKPSPVVNIEFHQTFAAHFQKEGLPRRFSKINKINGLTLARLGLCTSVVP
jgi:hypothetical protein